VVPRVEVRHLQAVLALAEELNFTRAAERLNITQSAVSKQINEIEKHHGFHLFRRKNKKTVELSEVGRIFVEELLGRFPRYEVTGRAERVRSTTVAGIRSLPVVLAPAG